MIVNGTKGPVPAFWGCLTHMISRRFQAQFAMQCAEEWTPASRGPFGREPARDPVARLALLERAGWLRFGCRPRVY